MSPGIELGTSRTEGRALNQLCHPRWLLVLKYNNNDNNSNNNNNNNNNINTVFHNNDNNNSNNNNNDNSQKRIIECNTFIALAYKQPSHAFEPIADKSTLEIIGMPYVQLVDSLK